MSEIMIFLLGVVIGLTGMGVTCWLLDAVGKEDEQGWMSRMKAGYIVMYYPRHRVDEVAYTGTIYEDLDEAKIEWIRAKEDPEVDGCWVETLLCPDDDDD